MQSMMCKSARARVSISSNGLLILALALWGGSACGESQFNAKAAKEASGQGAVTSQEATPAPPSSKAQAVTDAASTAEKPAHRVAEHLVQVAQDGSMNLDGKSVSLAELSRKLKPNTSVRISSSKETSHQRIVEIMDVLKAQGSRLIALGVADEATDKSAFPKIDGDLDTLVRGVPRVKLLAAYGAPKKSTEFAMEDILGEFHVSLLNDYSDDNPANSKVRIKEDTWWNGEGRFTIWSHQVNGEWLGLQALGYDAGDEF